MIVIAEKAGTISFSPLWSCALARPVGAGSTYALPAFLRNFRRNMRLGVAAIAMMSLMPPVRDADAAGNITEYPTIYNNCAAWRSLQGSPELTAIASGAGTGYATIRVAVAGSVDGCGLGVQDFLHYSLNGMEEFGGCLFNLASGGRAVTVNNVGAFYGWNSSTDFIITLPLTFLNGPNLIQTSWTGINQGVGDESWCILQLEVNHPPKITPPPPLLTVIPASSGPGTTVPPEPAGTPPPMPLVCGEVGGNTPMPVCVEGNCSAPTGFRYKCSTTYDVLTFTWDASAGAKGYNLRLNFKGNDSSTCKDGWYCPGSADENIIGTANTSYSFDVIPGAEYKAWIQYVGSDGKESGMQIFDPIVCKAP